MFYYIFYEKLMHFFTPFNVFHYITFRAIMASITGLAVSLYVASIAIPYLKRLNFKDQFKGYEPENHKHKSGTPTIGGVIFWSGFYVSSLLWARLDNVLVWITLFGTALFILIGFTDDYLKIKRGNNKGLSARTKFALQTLSAALISYTIFKVESSLTHCSGCLYLPFIKHGIIQMGYLYILFAMLVIVGTSNAVNLTDGLDGLATGPALTTIMPLIIFAYVSGNTIFAHYLHVPYIKGAGEISIMLAALGGSLLGFLWFNCYPAEVFMGDTGSLALGGFLGMVAVIIKEEIVLAIAGGIFVLETISVIIQILSYKTTGERVLKMAPLHHHYELNGWPESKVIVRFWIISIIFALLSLTALKIR